MDKNQPEQAVNELLSWTTAEHYINVINELWEAWICGELADGLKAHNRAERFLVVKELKKFFKSIKDE